MTLTTGRCMVVRMKSTGKNIAIAREAKGWNQSELARELGVTPQSVQAWESGRNTPRPKRLQEIAAALGVSASRLMGEDDSPPIPTHGAEPRTPSESDYALIPQYTAKGDCGNGYLNDHVEVNGGLAFKREWLRRIGAKPENCYVIYADGDSMEPYIFEGDVVLFDTSCVEPIDQKVYAIRRSDGGISIKRLVRQISGGWLIRSDSTDKARYPDEPVSDAVLHEVPIVGRVIWRGGGVS